MAALAPLEFTAEEEAGLKKMFDRLDKEKKGYITPDNIKALVSELGHEMKAGKAEELVAKCDPTKSGKITWEPFVKAMSVALPKLVAAIVLVAAFKVLDEEETGYIARADLEKLVVESGAKVDKARLDELINKTKPGPDGRIEFKTFVQALVTHLKSV